MGNLVTIQVFDNSISAYISKTRLESEGIEVFLFNENISTVYPIFNHSSGGIQLAVSESDAEKALDILDKYDNPESQK